MPPALTLNQRLACWLVVLWWSVLCVIAVAGWLLE